MSGSNLVIVESPAKAKTINKYLGPDFTVLASFGHIRDLPPKDGSVRPEEDFAMSWELGDRSKRHVDEISRAIRGVDHVFLATDPDREGEAIAWHVQEVLREAKLLDKVDVRRVTFNEITKGAVLDAMKRPRDLNRELIEAYLARRALDYLVGFTLSPVLWRKLPGSRSAGRVQSVALRLICEREAEIEVFKPQEYWSIEVVFQTAGGAQVRARLTQLDGKRLDKFALGEAGVANAVVERLKPLSYAVHSVEHKQVKRNPYPPFTTSTLQQEASRKLGMGATRTMRVAQKLYEGVDIGGEAVGLITYMRTDGVQLSNDAIGQVRELIGSQYGGDYVPDSPRIYKSAAKNAQEAHEAIRPTDLLRRPEDVAHQLERDELRLYELIWKRTVASQMESAVLDQVAVDIASSDGKAVLRATGSVVLFDGFLRVYQEERDDSVDEKLAAEDEAEARLPPVKEGDAMKRGAVDAEQHFTQPPPRYTEASLVKKLEELGIGRPSTYASIMQVLQDRDYVELDKRRFVPQDRGRLVTAFLTSFFERYVEYNFTADLETKLDDVSGGRLDWKTVLRDFWKAFSAAVEGTKDLTITQVIDELDKDLGPHFFPNTAKDGTDPRVCPSCHAGRLGLKLSRNGAFIGCSNYPDCRYTRSLAVATGDEEADALADGPRELGDDPETGLPVSVRRGPYGAYVQLGPRREAAPPVEVAAPEPEPEAGAKKTKGKAKAKPKAEVEKPKRVSLPKGMSPTEIDLETALKLLALPRDVGPHPETKDMITAGIGRFGPYLKLGSTYKSLAPDDDVLTIGLNRAVVLLAEAKKGPAQVPGRALGDHPRDGKPVSLNNGRFGPYVKHGKLMASLPKAMVPNAEELTLQQAIELLDAKAAKDGGKAPAAKGKAAKAAPEEKTKDAEAAPAKKPAAKAAPKKAPAKKPATASKAAPAKPKARAVASGD
ncbi:type I DNA topoisomerase [Skermanella rosea]|uniref:type I DNA topoisomerase n=1 Tax=Skermanella rosea TaxID=1817965 RepID=UPI0019319684|nr:type I DNA topoisomerase [Skermanella rosea]UEM05132.1 type I DNA topoisomerase [Skermanella rosea]